MNVLQRFDAGTRAHLLDLIGVVRFERRSKLSVTETESVAQYANPTLTPAKSATGTKGQSAKAPAFVPSTSTKTTRPSLLDELKAELRTPQLLLLVESPRNADTAGLPLLNAIRALLPAHRLLDAGDPPESWPAFSIALGTPAAVPSDANATLHAAPLLGRLRHDAKAKRALWDFIRPLRRAH